MVRIIKYFSWLAILAVGLQHAGAFSLLGPNNELYQDPSIGYNPNGFIDAQTIAPKNIGEEYRRNTPVLYYTFDQNFLDFYGANGVAAVEAAFETINGLAETNLSFYSADLSEFPLEASRVNYRAQALELVDVKSTVMQLIVEQLGLTHPDRYAWTLHGREHFGTVPCPVGQQYTVIKRNFDPVMGGLDQLLPTSYVNGTLYTYRIVEYCDTATSPIPPLLADATEFPVDPLANTFTAVASGNVAPILYGGIAFTLNSGQLVGNYYTGLTRDDVGGLRYLLRTNNLNIEAAGSNTVTFITNTAIQLLFTSNLTQLADAAFVNDAATLAAQFPGLQIASTTQIFTNLVTTNTVFYFTNYPFSIAGSVASLASGTVITTNVAIRYKHEFANVVTNHYFTNGIITITTTNSSASACPPFTPVGLFCTIVTQTSYQTNGVFGDYYLIPTNACGISLIATQLIHAITITNGTVIAANVAATNVLTQFFSQTTSYNFNQYVYQVRAVVCPGNTLALRQGIEKIRFVRRDFDSLLNQFYYPQTNDYVLNSITNNTLVPQTIRRIATFPDILFTAADLAGGPGSVGIASVGRSFSFETGNALQNLAGPGTILSSTVMTFNKVGPAYGNVYPALGEDTQIPLLIWGSFDGTTNAPVVYPNGSSIVNLENQVLIQILPAGSVLPDGKVGVNYATAGFTVNGGTPPYTWSLPPGFPGLPGGLSLNSATGAITGVPTAANVYDVTIRMTDSIARFVDRNYTITVNP